MVDHDSRRDFSRVETHIDVEIECEGKIFGGRLIDVSMHGIGGSSAEILPLQAECLVRLFLGEPRESSICILANGKIVRSSEHGFAVDFTEIDLDSFEHLRNLVRMNAENVSQVEGELKEHLGLKKPTDA